MLTTDAPLLQALRHALNHLYDPEQLRSSALLGLFALAGQPAAHLKLQHILLEAIGVLRPPPQEPQGSAQRRIYQVLQLRYEQQFAQKEVAVQLGLSVRQYRRLQQAAVEALAFHLIEKHDLEPRLAELAAAFPAEAAAPEAGGEGAGGERTVDAAGSAAGHVAPAEAAGDDLPESLQWLRALAPNETADLGRALPEILRLVEPLAAQRGKRVTLAVEGAPGQVAVHPLVLRQALLHLLNAAILETEGDAVGVLVEGDRRQAAISVCGGPARMGAAGAEGDGAEGDGAEPDGQSAQAMVRQMLKVCRVELEEDSSGRRRAVLRVECVEPQPILLIDDHADTADLLLRYTEGTRYRLLTCPDPTRALEVAEEQQPLIILLDVMMPRMDGWEVLTRLKQYEATAAIPVYVCTVLDQAELALSLGADGFLRKPLTRQALLEAAQQKSSEATLRGPAPR